MLVVHGPITTLHNFTFEWNFVRRFFEESSSNVHSDPQEMCTYDFVFPTKTKNPAIFPNGFTTKTERTKTPLLIVYDSNKLSKRANLITNLEKSYGQP